MGYKIYLVENQDETKLTAAFPRTQALWNALIPKCDTLVAKASQSLASKVAHYTERGAQK